MTLRPGARVQNVEYKAELRDPSLARAVCGRIGALHIGTLRQTDTYYRIPDGRLKKRETEGEPVEFIFYHRANRLRPKLSHFTIYDEAAAAARFGQLPLPIWVTVRKVRDLWTYQDVRIHLDEVEGLGAFLEFEAMVTNDRHVGRCHQLIEELREHFRPTLGEPVSASYSDMIALDVEEKRAR
jgi:adenylate cyclase class IV